MGHAGALYACMAHGYARGYDHASGRGYQQQPRPLAGTQHGGGECPLRRALGGF